MRFINASEINNFTFLQMPISLIENPSYRDLSSNDRIVYSVLNRRTQLSARHGKYIDKDGNVFVKYTVEKMSAYLNLSESTIKRSYKALEEFNLVYRMEETTNNSSFRKSYRLYVLRPKDETSVVSDYDFDDLEDSDSDDTAEPFEGVNLTPSSSVNLTPSNVSKRALSNKELVIKNNLERKDQKITANAGTPLFDLPKNPSSRQLTRMELAQESGDFSKVTMTEFVQYFIERQNEVFPIQIQFARSAEFNSCVGAFRDNLVDAYKIEKNDICSAIDKLIRIYRDTQTHPDYRDCFSLETFKRSGVISRLMSRMSNLDQYGSDKKKIQVNTTGEIF